MFAFITFTFPIYLFANEKQSFIKVGVNQSTFRGESSYSNGVQVGVGMRFDGNEKSIQQKFVVVELLYAYRKGLLENKKFPNVPFLGEITSGTIGDVHAAIGYIEIPIKLGYSFKSYNQEKSINVYWGPSFALPIINNSVIEGKKEFLVDDDNKGIFDYEYYVNEGDLPLLAKLIETVTRTELHMMFGATARWRFLEIEFRYNLALTAIKDLKNAVRYDINEKLDLCYLAINITI